MKAWKFFILSLISLTIAACGNENAEEVNKDKEAGASVIKQFEMTQSSITYKDPATFTAGDKYLTPEFAKKYHEEMRAGMEKFIMDSKATVSGKEPTVTYKEHQDNNFIYDFEADRTITSEQTNSSVNSHVKYRVTVTKQKEGTFLISNMEEIS